MYSPRGTVLLALLRSDDHASRHYAGVVIRKAFKKHRYLEATADALGISSRSLQRVLAEHPEFRPRDAPTRGRPKTQPAKRPTNNRKSQP